MDAFTARLGVSEGRVERAPGDVVFALGDLTPGWTADFAAGDYVEVAQTADLTGVAVVRVTGTLRAPPAGRWRVSLRIGGFDAAAPIAPVPPLPPAHAGDLRPCRERLGGLEPN